MQNETVAKGVMAAAKQLPEGAVMSAKELLHLGSRPAVDQALKRLAVRKELLRAARGLYVRPVHTRFGIRAPSAEKVMKEIARIRSETIARHGAAAANALGLTTQVPIRSVYLTTGRIRKLKLGAESIELHHAPPWMLRQSLAGEVLRALCWMGKSHVGEALVKLKNKLPPEALEELVASRPALPGWLSKSISDRLVSRG